MGAFATMTAGDWRFWTERENATFREQTALGTYTAHALSATGGAAKRRAPTWREQAASAGAYTAKNLVWLVPQQNLPVGVAPKAGDVIRDASGVDHTVLEVQLGKFGQTHRCTTIALAVVYALSELGTLTRPVSGRDNAGRPLPAGYDTVASDVRCRVQPEDGTAGDVDERRVIPLRYTGFLETPLAVRARDRFTVAEVTYTVLGFRNPERLGDLMQLTLELVRT